MKMLDQVKNQKEVLKYTEEEKKNILLKILDRYDFYVNSTNSKASLIIAWNSIVIGTILLKFEEITSNYLNIINGYAAASCILIMLGMSCIYSISIVFRVVYPFLKENTKTEKAGNSLIFFGSVSGMDIEKFCQNFNRLGCDDFIKDLSEQVVVVAKGLNEKMLLMRKSIKQVYFELILIALLIILKLFGFISIGEIKHYLSIS